MKIYVKPTVLSFQFRRFFENFQKKFRRLKESYVKWQWILTINKKMLKCVTWLEVLLQRSEEVSKMGNGSKFIRDVIAKSLGYDKTTSSLEKGLQVATYVVATLQLELQHYRKPLVHTHTSDLVIFVILLPWSSDLR